MVKLLTYSTTRLEQLGAVGTDADTTHNMGERTSLRIHKKKRKGHNYDLLEKNEVDTVEKEEDEDVGISMRRYRLQKLGACISAWRMVTDACLGIQGRAMYSYHATADTASVLVSTRDTTYDDTGTHPTSNATNSIPINPVSAPVELICAICGVSGGSVARCSRCKRVSYCSVKHQKQHWTVHKVRTIHTYSVTSTPTFMLYLYVRYTVSPL